MEGKGRQGARALGHRREGRDAGAASPARSRLLAGEHATRSAAVRAPGPRGDPGRNPGQGGEGGPDAGILPVAVPRLLGGEQQAQHGLREALGAAHAPRARVREAAPRHDRPGRRRDLQGPEAEGRTGGEVGEQPPDHPPEDAQPRRRVGRAAPRAAGEAASGRARRLPVPLVRGNGALRPGRRDRVEGVRGHGAQDRPPRRRAPRPQVGGPRPGGRPARSSAGRSGTTRRGRRRAAGRARCLYPTRPSRP